MPSTEKTRQGFGFRASHEGIHDGRALREADARDIRCWQESVFSWSAEWLPPTIQAQSRRVADVVGLIRMVGSLCLFITLRRWLGAVCLFR